MEGWRLPIYQDTVATDSGVLVDSSRPQVTISGIANGRLVPVRQVLDAVLDCFPTTAQHDARGNCKIIQGVGFLADAVLHIGRYQERRLSCKVVFMLSVDRAMDSVRSSIYIVFAWWEGW